MNPKNVEVAVEKLGMSLENAIAQMKSGDPNSALAQEIAMDSDKKPEEIAGELQKTAKAAEVQDKKLGWVCMFCGSTNPDCPYKGRADRERFNALRE